MSKIVTILAALGAVLAAIALAVGAYVGGWWLQTDSTNRQTHLDRSNYGTQTALVHELHTKVAQVAEVDVQLTSPNLTADQRAALTAQRKAMVSGACYVTDNVTQDLPSDLASWVATNC